MKTRIEIFGAKSQKLLTELRRFLSSLLKEQKCQAKKLSVIFVDNDQIRKLNRKFLGRNRITDVLAFPFDEVFWERSMSAGKGQKTKPRNMA